MRTRIYKKNFWFNEEEKEVLAYKSELAKMTESDFIRKLVLGYQLKEKPDDRFYDVMRTLRNTANNLNQLAKRANTQGFIDEKDYHRQVDRLNEFIDKIKEEYLLNKQGDG